MGNKTIINKSIIIATRDDIIVSLVKDFDLSDKTPIDCMEFVRKLKSLCDGSK